MYCCVATLAKRTASCVQAPIFVAIYGRKHRYLPQKYRYLPPNYRYILVT